MAIILVCLTRTLDILKEMKSIVGGAVLENRHSHPLISEKICLKGVYAIHFTLEIYCLVK